MTAGCGSNSGTTASVAKTPTVTKTAPATAPTNPNTFGEISLTSSAFKNGQEIPATYTCAGANISPPLKWHKLPADAKELFMVALDVRKDGRNKVVWTFGGIKPTDAQIAAGAVPPGAILGLNGKGKSGWGGVCGPKGERHRIAFLIYALRRKLHLKPGFSPVAIRTRLKAATISTGLTLANYRHP
jgi:Raf kinase inhibitor-like YbhB/YbcL family protein